MKTHNGNRKIKPLLSSLFLFSSRSKQPYYCFFLGVQRLEVHIYCCPNELWFFFFFYPAKIKLSISLHVVALVGQFNGRHCVLSFPNYVCKYVKLWMIALLRAETIKPSCLQPKNKNKILKNSRDVFRQTCIHIYGKKESGVSDEWDHRVVLTAKSDWICHL